MTSMGLMISKQVYKIREKNLKTLNANLKRIANFLLHLANYSIEFVIIIIIIIKVINRKYCYLLLVIIFIYGQYLSNKIHI